jgi:hypothetical protein
MTTRKLGKKPQRIDTRTLHFRNYATTTAAPFPGPLPIPPAEISYVVKVPSWPLLLNDQLGDCVIAAMGHMVQQWTYFSSDGAAMRIMTDAEALEAYEAIAGYNPDDPNTDQGTDMLTALNYWRNTGITVAGEKDQIAGYVAVNPQDLLEVRQAIWMFGNLFIGLQMPQTAESENAWTVADGGIYTAQGAPGSWGGHCVSMMAESPETLTCVTWGERLKLSHNFMADYADEAYAVLSNDWITSQGDTIAGFDLAALRRDIAAL